MYNRIHALIFLGIFSLFVTVSFAQNNVIVTCEKTVFDFGEILEKDGKVSHTFVVKNEGTVPLVISKVTTSCGCTTSDWTKEPISTGKTGELKVTYDPKNRPGVFIRTIQLYANGIKNSVIFTIRGKVIQAR